MGGDSPSKKKRYVSSFASVKRKRGSRNVSKTPESRYLKTKDDNIIVDQRTDGGIDKEISGITKVSGLENETLQRIEKIRQLRASRLLKVPAEEIEERDETNNNNKSSLDKFTVENNTSQEAETSSVSRTYLFNLINQGEEEDENFKPEIGDTNGFKETGPSSQNKSYDEDDEDFEVTGTSGIKQEEEKYGIKEETAIDELGDTSDFEETGPSSQNISYDEDDEDFEVAGTSGINKRLYLNKSPKRLNDSSDEDDTDLPLDEIRRRNEKKMMAFMESLRNPELEKQFAESNKRKRETTTKAKFGPNTKKKRSNRDSTFRFTGLIPTELRKSSRLQKKKPEYRDTDLEDIQETSRKTYFKNPDYRLSQYNLEDLEDIVYKPKRKSSGKKKSSRETEHVIIPVEDVTQEMLDNIALRVSIKVYSPYGTSCHQCRQKTLDQKSCCRNPECTGTFGMFCGVCLKNRYGEEVADVLLNPNWICPVCRDRCNCSICRTKKGKRPTGILAPLALQSGFESVDHFLDDLNGEGDRPEEDKKYLLKRDPEALLGFFDDGRRAYLRSGPSDFLHCTLCALTDCENPDNLLGFSNDGNFAVVGGFKKELLFNPKNTFFSALDLVLKK